MTSLKTAAKETSKGSTEEDLSHVVISSADFKNIQKANHLTICRSMGERASNI